MTISILIVEDNPQWQTDLRNILSSIADVIEITQDHRQASDLIKNTRFDLITFDLEILTDGQRLKTGIELLETLRRSENNRYTETIIISGTGEWPDVVTAFRNYGIFDYFSKTTDPDAALVRRFSRTGLLESARAAVLKTLLARADRSFDDQIKLHIELDLSGTIRCELSPSLHDPLSDQIADAHRLTDLTRRADQLNLLLLHGQPDDWRWEARSIGKELFDLLDSSAAFHDCGCWAKGSRRVRKSF